MQVAQVSFPGSAFYLEVVDMARPLWRFRKFVILRTFVSGFTSTAPIGSYLSGAPIFGSQASSVLDTILLLILTGSSFFSSLISFFIGVTEVSLSEYETTFFVSIFVYFTKPSPKSWSYVIVPKQLKVI